MGRRGRRGVKNRWTSCWAWIRLLRMSRSRGPAGGTRARPNTRGHADPLRSLQEAPPPVAGAEPDHVSDLHAPWSNARWNESSARAHAPGRGRGVLLALTSRRHAGRQAAPATPAPPPARGKPRGNERPRDLQGDKTISPEHALASQSAHDLLPALLEGLGVPDLPVDRLTPALMFQLGQILRESTEGHPRPSCDTDGPQARNSRGRHHHQAPGKTIR